MPLTDCGKLESVFVRPTVIACGDTEIRFFGLPVGDRLSRFRLVILASRRARNHGDAG